MYCWYKNKRAGIFFNNRPLVCVRCYLPQMSEEELLSVKKYPFVNKKELPVLLKDYKKNKQYKLTIPKGYCYDGASIPKFFWRVIGTNADNRFLIPAMIHDILCEHHEYINNDRSFSTEVFNALLECSGVSQIKRFFMKNSVACFQTICCKWSE